MTQAKALPLIVREPVVLTVIALNGIVLFLDAFPSVHAHSHFWIQWVDMLFVGYFVAEVFIKVRHYGSFRKYFADPWNAFDFIIIALSTPALVSPFISLSAENIGALTVLRVVRILRLIRPLRLVPDADKIWPGIYRALRASVGILLILVFLNLILSLMATLLFGGIPEAKEFFGNPFAAMYSLLKVFTVEGWYEIPELLAERGVSDRYLLLLRIYFAATVLICGIFGLSIANAVFVDTLVADNSDELEEKVEKLYEELREFRAEVARWNSKG